MAAAIVTRRMVLGGMAAAALPASLRHAHAAQSLMPEPVAVPAGAFLYGSTPGQRRLAYALDERAYGHARTREMGWYDNEPPLSEGRTGAFEIASTPVTNRQYGAFLRATGHPPPDVDPRTWAGYGLIHPYERTRRHAWSDAHTPPPGRLDHPVVLVAHADARAYARWRSAETGVRWRLPDEREWEKAARGTDGRLFPWGDEWEASRLNSHDAGPFDTLPVGRFPAGASPYGMLDAAGQVFEWTATPAGEGRFIVKGGSWDDSGCGICRPAARHARPAGIRHILIGFRLLREVPGA